MWFADAVDRPWEGYSQEEPRKQKEISTNRCYTSYLDYQRENKALSNLFICTSKVVDSRFLQSVLRQRGTANSIGQQQ